MDKNGNRIRKTVCMLLAGIMTTGLSGCGLFPDEARIDDTLRVAHFTPAEHFTVKVKRGNLEYSDTTVLKYCSRQEKEYYIKCVPDNSRWDYGIKIYAVEGDIVKKGQLLVEAPCDDVEEEIKGYEEQIGSLQAEAGYQQKLLELAQSDAERQSYVNAVSDLQGQVNVLKLRKEEAEEKLADYRIYADMDGQITYIVNLMFGYDTSKPFLRITSTEGYFEGEAEQSLITFKVGDTVPVEVAGSTRQMVVKSIGGDSTAENKEAQKEEGSGEQKFSDLGEAKVAIQLAGDGEFEAEQRAQLLLSSGKRDNVLYIPVSAVMIDEDKAYVCMLADDGFMRAKEIQVGEVIDGYYIIKSGLEEGEEIVND